MRKNLKKALSLAAASVMAISLFAGCGGTDSSSESSSSSAETGSESASMSEESSAASSESASTSEESASTSSTSETSEYPEIDLNNTTVYGDVGPDGSVPGGLDDVMLTEEEKEQVREGNYKVAICYHQLDNQVNQSKLQACQAVLEDLNIEVVCVTDAQSDAVQEVDQLETALALEPDLLISMPYDVEVTKAAYQQYIDAGIPIVFMENAHADFVPGEDYVCVTNSDSYGNGMYAAHFLAQAIGYEGTVAMVYYDADFFTTNERDRAFRETMAEYYPDIEIVAEAGFTSIDVVGTVADGLFAQYPDVDGVYASWDIPAADVITSARAIGRDDLKVTGVDLGDDSAYMIANQDMYYGTGCPKATETGEIEGYAIACALLGKEIPTYLCSSSQPVCYDNVLEAYNICFNIDAPAEIAEAWESHQQ
jgi:ribose transport system substrate-binding protein